MTDNTSQIPQAGKERACELLNAETSLEKMGYQASWRITAHSEHPTVTAFARYIAEVSDALKTTRGGGDPVANLAAFILPEPVDPLLIEAREIVAQAWDAKKLTFQRGECYRAGKLDGDGDVQMTLTALRRGIELGERGQ